MIMGQAGPKSDFQRTMLIIWHILDLKKAYDTMDWDRCLEILDYCAVGFKALKIIKIFWDNKVLVCKASGYYGRVFKVQ